MSGGAGLVTVSSARGFADTLRALEDALHRRGVEIFARIDHAANAAAAGLTLTPSTVLIFGAAKAGTPVMQAQPSLGLDLPLRALVYEDITGKAFIAYNAPDWIVARQGVTADAFPSVVGMNKLLESVVAEATARSNAP